MSLYNFIGIVLWWKHLISYVLEIVIFRNYNNIRVSKGVIFEGQDVQLTPRHPAGEDHGLLVLIRTGAMAVHVLVLKNIGVEHASPCAKPLSL